MFIIFCLIYHSFFFQFSFYVIPTIVFSWWPLNGSLPSWLLNSCLCWCGWPCAHVTINIPLDTALKHIFLLISSFSYNDWVACLLFPIPYCIRISIVDVRFLLEYSNVYLMPLSGQWHPYLINMQVPGCLFLKQNVVVVLLHGWHSGILLVFQ